MRMLIVARRPGPSCCSATARLTDTLNGAAVDILCTATLRQIFPEVFFFNTVSETAQDLAVSSE